MEGPLAAEIYLSNGSILLLKTLFDVLLEMLLVQLVGGRLNVLRED
jgi:hypothetical protein